MVLLALAAGHLRRTFVIVSVQGGSMAPTLRDGERVVVRRTELSQLRRGDVVVLRPPGPAGGPADNPRGRPGWNIKRVAALPGDPVPDGTHAALAGSTVPPGALIVLGDSADSIDSRHRGIFSGDRLLGKAVRRLGGAAL